MTVGRICVRDVDLADEDESVQVAAARMTARNVGTLVVCDDARRPTGILTDRDVALKVVGRALDPFTTRVADVMTHAPQTVQEDTPIEQALAVMRRGPFRRLPVVDASGALVGLLSLDDILSLLAEEFGQIGSLLWRESPSSLGAVGR